MAKKQTKSRGRPTKFKDEMCDQLVEVMAEGASKTAVAAHLGIHKDTLYEWANPDSEYFKQNFSDALKEGMVKAQLWWENLLRDAASGGNKDANATLIIFTMKNQFRDDWADIQTFENTHKFAVSDTPEQSEDEWLEASKPT